MWLTGSLKEQFSGSGKQGKAAEESVKGSILTYDLISWAVKMYSVIH